MIVDLLIFIILEKRFVGKSQSGVDVSLVLVVLYRVTAIVHVEPILLTKHAQIFAGTSVVVFSAHFSEMDQHEILDQP